MKTLFNKYSLLMTFALLLISNIALAQRDLTDIPSPDPELEKQALQVHPDFEINLYASDPLMAKPIQMNFDPEGRLWIVSSETYPHIKPGEESQDKVLILEDTDEDGTADKTTVFAEGLLIPTGIEPTSNGKGAYVANSTDLLYLEDTDNDGKADHREILLSGFGTEDTHHILHTFRWGPDGRLYMNQSIYIHSHLETPTGVKRLNGSGIWRFQPETMDLEIVSRGMVNPWGHHFDDWGQAFATDGAGQEGIQYIFNGSAYFTAVGVPRLLTGLNMGSPKYCGMEIIGGSQLPEEWQGNILTNDFRGHRVCRFTVSENKSGFATREQEELIKTEHVAFRPIDIKMGPDGAIYIADWYNPIIQHGEVDFRDERRDHTHGRIWRLTYKKKPVVKRESLSKLNDDELINRLVSPEPWVRHQTKRLLKDRGSELSDKLSKWVQTQNQNSAQYERNLLEALWVFQAWDKPNKPLLKQLLGARDHKARAAATRVMIDWLHQLPEADSLLDKAVQDEHPRVRLEAVRALARLNNKEAMLSALTVLDQPMDEFLDYALWVTARELQSQWLPAVESGDSRFLQNTGHLLFLLNSLGNQGDMSPLVQLVRNHKISNEQLPQVYQLFLQRQKPDELRLVFDALFNQKLAADLRASWLNSLAETSIKRNIKPDGDLGSVSDLLQAEQQPLQKAALHAIGAWKLAQYEEKILAFLEQETFQPMVIPALARLGTPTGREKVMALATDSSQKPAQLAAVTALLQQNDPESIPVTVDFLTHRNRGEQLNGLFSVLLQDEAKAKQLAAALKDKRLTRDVGVIALRTIQKSGRKFPELSAAITSAANIKSGPVKLKPAEMQRMVALIKEKGNAAKGEEIYRQKELACMTCHAIAGAGGRVGPDLLSLGASAQVDYLVDSLLAPNAKVKENYHTTVVITDDGKTAAGIKVRETDSDLILRNAEDSEFSIPLDSIEEVVQGASMMPAGLTESLTAMEFVHLVRFLSELGRTSEFSTNNKQVVRSWETLNATDQASLHFRRIRIGTVTQDHERLTWSPSYSTVSGELPLDVLPGIRVKHVQGKDSQGWGFARCQLNVAQATEITLKLNNTDGLQIWVGEKPLTPASEMSVKLEEGTHRITIAVNKDVRSAPVKLELKLPTGSESAASWVLGK